MHLRSLAPCLKLQSVKSQVIWHATFLCCVPWPVPSSNRAQIPRPGPKWGPAFRAQAQIGTNTLYADCNLRQGAGGTEFARKGSRTCFLKWFYKCSQAYFGQKPEEHGFSSGGQKRRFLRNMCYRKVGFKIACLMKFLDASAWLCVEKLRKHSFETKQVKRLFKIPQQSPKIRKKSPY